MSTEGLTIKQQHFVETYATCNNVAQALATAGYTTSRSPDTKPFGGFRCVDQALCQQGE